MKSIMFANYELESTNNTIVINYKSVVMYCNDEQLYDFEYINSVLMIENVVF